MVRSRKPNSPRLPHASNPSTPCAQQEGVDDTQLDTGLLWLWAWTGPGGPAPCVVGGEVGETMAVRQGPGSPKLGQEIGLG